MLKLLLRRGVISQGLCEGVLRWRYGGFSAHNLVRVSEGDAKGSSKHAEYMLRASTSLQEMRCDEKTGTAIYHPKMHAVPKQNFQLTPGAE